eukprot:g60242.t1
MILHVCHRTLTRPLAQLVDPGDIIQSELNQPRRGLTEWEADPKTSVLLLLVGMQGSGFTVARANRLTGLRLSIAVCPSDP